ncbi:histidine kinase/DNA gyrase B/HSP90-like ATPase [Streptomyces sp. SLBN-118]|uniref:sensor histidine kinase n=1 Tax=Streptomyces sp. SLBN-118 TaxID=2768454 RepID=UPI00117131CB|nr:ATP-binding protein [Streptomyces sp. SLBN-118]TQK50880.1 histidine kinase/DNA gyrase B/HSP90-like ATPase [Streptomyces sp. SLBN-118]
MLALVPSAALILLWAANAYRSLTEGLDLSRQAELGRSLDPKLDTVRWNLETELRISVTRLADPRTSLGALESQRNMTDNSIKKLGDLEHRLQQAPEKVRTAQMPFAVALRDFPLQQLRTQINQRSAATSTVMESFTYLINKQVTSAFQARQVPQGPLVSQAQPLSMLIITSQALHLEDTLMSQGLPSGTMSPDQRVAFMTPLGLQRSMLNYLASIQSPAEQSELARITNTAAWKRMAAVENAVVAARTDARGGMMLSPGTAQWRSDLNQLEAGLEDLIRARTARLLSAQADTAATILRRDIAAALAGLAAVIVSATLSWRVSRSLLHRMAGLRAATLDLATQRLPAIVARLNRGETVDVEAEALDLDYGTDQVGQVAEAFNAVQRTGIRSAVELADTRRGLQKAIVLSARRSQSLVNGQLALLDELERKYQDPEVLTDLYQLDSQTSQLRRYEENLLIIGGAWPGRRGNQPVLLSDVLRSAVGEVSQYQRITVSADDSVRLIGPAVAAVVHLMAELMENAAKFSPPFYPVSVRVDTVLKGVSVEIEDRGIGMAETEYADANLRLAQPPVSDVLSIGQDARLGLLVITHLAVRLGITVTLRPSAFGGTSAVVLIPQGLLVRNTELVHGTEHSNRPEAPAADAVPPDHLRRSGQFWPFDGQRAAAVPAAATSDAPAGPTQNDRAPGEPPPLPQRTPQASMAQELGLVPTPHPHPPEPPGQPPSPERAAHTLSAFQRGTAHARRSSPGSSRT